MRATTIRTDPPQTVNVHIIILLAETFLDLLPVLTIAKVHLKIRERGARTGGINLEPHFQQGVQSTQIAIDHTIIGQS